MARFLGLPVIAPTIVDWTPDRSYSTAAGDVRVITSDSHRFDIDFTVRDASGRYDMQAILKTHYAQNRGVAFETPMLQELRSTGNDYGRLVLQQPTRGLMARSFAAAGESAVRLSNPTPRAFTLPVGWYVTFANHTKVYRVTSYGVVSGALTLGVYPTLRTAVPTTTRVNVAPMYTCRYNPESPLEIPYDERGLSTASVSLVERV